jgi:hypothetical protein
LGTHDCLSLTADRKPGSRYFRGPTTSSDPRVWRARHHHGGAATGRLGAAATDGVTGSWPIFIDDAEAQTIPGRPVPRRPQHHRQSYCDPRALNACRSGKLRQILVAPNRPRWLFLVGLDVPGLIGFANPLFPVGGGSKVVIDRPTPIKNNTRFLGAFSRRGRPVVVRGDPPTPAAPMTSRV